MFVVQSRGRGRTGLGEVQGSARSGGGLHTHRRGGPGLSSNLRARIIGAWVHGIEKGSTLVVAAVGSSGGTDRAGLGENGSQGNGRAQGKGHTRATAGTGGSADGGAGLWNAGHGGEQGTGAAGLWHCTAGRLTALGNVDGVE